MSNSSEGGTNPRHRSASWLLCAFAVVIGVLFFRPTTLNRSSRNERVTVGANVSQKLFAGELYRVEIDVQDSEMASLKTNPRSYVRADVRIGEHEWEDVGLRLKGHSTFLPVSQKPSMVLKFDKWRSTGRFGELKKIALNNSIDDPSYLSELAANACFRAAGLPAPRVGHAAITLNGRDLGLFTAIEGIDECFLAQFFDRTDGDLYEGEDSDVDGGIQHDSGPGFGNASIKALVRLASEPDYSKRLNSLSGFVNLEALVKFAALEALIWNSDGYTSGKHNYRLYFDPATQKLIIFPHGMDVTFVHPNAPLLLPRNGLLIRAIMDIPSIQESYRRQCSDLSSLLSPTSHIFRIVANGASNVLAFARTKQECTQLSQDTSAFVRRLASRHEMVQAQLKSQALYASNVQAPLQLRWRLMNGSHVPGVVTNHTAAQEILALVGRSRRANESWGADILLNKGAYRFTGLVKVTGMATFEPNGCGARLRIHGHPEPPPVRLSDGWVQVSTPFTVIHDLTWIGLRCDFISISGEAHFDRDSLSVHRVAQ